MSPIKTTKNIFLFVATSTLTIAPLNAAVISFDDLEAKKPKVKIQLPAEGKQQNSGQLTLNVEQSDQMLGSNFPLLIEIIDNHTGRKTQAVPGSSYNYQAGEYSVRIFRTKPGSTRPYESYQTIEETIKIKPGLTQQRSYPAPARRKKIASLYTLTLSGVVNMIGDSYEVSNPKKEHFDSLNVSNNLAETTSIGDSGFSAGISSGISLGLTYALPETHWVGELGYNMLKGENLDRTGFRLGGGYYTERNGAINLYTAGIGRETATWADARLTTANFGTTNISGSTSNPVLYLQWQRTPANGGLSYSFNLDVLNLSATAAVGWNFGGTHSRYSKAKVKQIRRPD